jgi:hypothetical protein
MSWESYVGKVTFIIIEIFGFQTTLPGRCIKIRIFDGECDGDIVDVATACSSQGNFNVLGVVVDKLSLFRTRGSLHR